MKKGDLYLVIILLSIMVGLSIVYKLSVSNVGERFVEIRINNELITTIKLTEEADITLLILTKDDVYQSYKVLDLDDKVPDNITGYDLVRIYNNGVQVLDADCPRRIIVKQGFRKHANIPLICLPRQLEIIIKSYNEETEVDGFAYNMNLEFSI